jgi:hypothetical protein
MYSGGGGGAVKPDGSFTIRNVNADTYRVRMLGNDALYIKSVYVNEQPAKDDEVAVLPGIVPSLRIVVSATGGQMTGEVKTEKDQPAQGATAVLVPDAPRRGAMHLYKTANTDQYGKFAIKGIPPGSYKLFAWEGIEPGQWTDPDFLAQHEAKGKAFAIRENDTHTAELTVISAGEETSR